MSDFVLQCNDLCKVFKDAGQQVDVFKDLNLEVDKGELVAIVGRSGTGKSTLLHLLGGLDEPSSGSVYVDGKNFQTLSEKQRSKIRNKSLGFIYQFHHLLPEFTALENVCIPLVMGSCTLKAASLQATALLEKVGLKERLAHKVSQLSGGERQRVAIARAMVTQPDCILADEPTGNLDGQTADHVFETMLNLNRESGTSLVIVTHDTTLANKMDKVYSLEQGKLVLKNAHRS